MKKLTTAIAVALFFVGMLSVSMNLYGNSQEESIFLADTTRSISSVPATLFSCAGPANENGWSYSAGFSTLTCGGKNYLGPYAASGVVTSPAFTVGAHQGIIVSFSLAYIDSWDGEYFRVSADGVNVYTSPAYRYNNANLASTCRSTYYNDVYQTITFGFNHSASTVTFAFTSNLNSAVDDESWGICDITVKSTLYPVTSTGNLVLPQVGLTPRTFMACNNPVNDDSWTYSAGYSSFICNGNNYLGPYAANGVVTSPAFPVDTHKGIVVSFKLAFIDSWDAEYFKITADGVTVYQSANYRYDNTRLASTCRNAGYNDVYQTITFGFNHTASTVAFALTSNLNSANDDESWGICDFTVTASQYPVSSTGVALTRSLSGNQQTFFACSSPVQDDYWTYSRGFSTVRCNGNTYLGPYAVNGVVSSLPFNLGAHQGVIVSFKLAYIDSWDGEYFKITADGVTVYQSANYRYNNANLASTCGNAGYNDAYQVTTFGFNHSASTVAFAITSNLNSETDDEAWGICDFTVSTSQFPVTSTGSVIKMINAFPTTYFSCANVVADDKWTYSAGFSTISCNGKSYLGPYASRGVVSSSAFPVDTHRGIVVTFNLAVIDSWDDEYLTITVDNVQVYRSRNYKYNNALLPSTCRNTAWNDVYETITFGFNHTASTATFSITSNLNSANDDESWGICDLTLSTSQYPVSSTGAALIKTINGNLQTFFPCSNQVQDVYWTYSAGFSTVNCNGNTYVGPYASAGVVTSLPFALGAHTTITVSFNLAYIDSWDGEYFRVLADGVAVYQSPSYRYNNTPLKSTCRSADYNDSYQTINFSFAHTASTVTFAITSNLNSAIDDESWGICNLAIKAT